MKKPAPRARAFPRFLPQGGCFYCFFVMRIAAAIPAQSTDKTKVTTKKIYAPSRALLSIAVMTLERNSISVLSRMPTVTV